MLDSVRRLLLLPARIGADDQDSSSERLRKTLLVTVSLMVLPAGAVWGTLYWIFDERGAALFPWGYAVLSVLSLTVFGITRSYRFLRSAELLLILIAPFALSLALGGLVPSSGVVLWSFLAPLGAIVFDGPRRAWGWFGAFLVLVLVNMPLAPVVRATAVALPPELVRAFTALNIGGVSLISFTLLALFAQQRQAAQQRVEDLLLNILPVDIAERLQQEPRSIADHFEEASVLFADVVDFTPLSTRLRPTEIVGLLDRLFSEFDELVDRHDVEKIKTIGDCYMVAAGVPRARPDHARALVHLALEMRERADRHVRGDEGTGLQLRIGINSGPVVAGVIGRRRFLYDLWGDAVNTASRMESHGSPGEIQVTRATWELIRDDFLCELQGTVEVKGKGPMETWFIIGPRPPGAPAEAGPRHGLEAGSSGESTGAAGPR